MLQILKSSKKNRIFFVNLWLVFVFLTGWCTSGLALDAPQGEVVLKVSGDIELTNNGDEAWFDLKMLQSLGATEFETATPWADEPEVFTGVRITTLMDSLGASGKSFHAVALDKYKVDFAGIDYTKYPAIIAWQVNGESLTVRTLGPLRVIFPYSDYPEIDIARYHNVAIWQLLQLEVH